MVVLVSPWRRVGSQVLTGDEMSPCRVEILVRVSNNGKQISVSGLEVWGDTTVYGPSSRSIHG